MGVYDLGLTSEQFYNLTPREFLALCERLKQAVERDDRRINTLAYIFAAGNLKKEDGSKFTPADFGLTPGPAKYNGHNVEPPNLKDFARSLSGHPYGREMRPDDPRAQVDQSEIQKFQEMMRG